MSTKRIGLDLDGVVYQWDKTARFMLREILPDSPYTKDGPIGKDSLSWDYIMENVSKDHWRWLWSDAVKLGLFRHGHLFPGSIKALTQLAEIGKIIAITSRPDTAVNDTLAWASYHQLPLSGLHIVGHGVKKSTITPVCDIYIDDKVENCEDLVTTGAVVAMPDRPYNQFRTPEGVTRIHSWSEFIDMARKA